MIPLPYRFLSFRNILKLSMQNCLSGKFSSILVSDKKKSNVSRLTSAIDSNLFQRELKLKWPSIILWGFDSFSFLMESIGFSWIDLSWLSDILELFKVLQGELWSTGFKMGALSFAGFSLWCHSFKFDDSF